MSFCTKPLGSTSISLSHASHGKLDIVREPRDGSSNKVVFTLSLTPRAGTPRTFKHQMYINDRDAVHGKHSTLGYGDIDLPVSMQHIGIGYAYHFIAAQAAVELGVDYLVVDSTATDTMRRLCTRIGMKDTFTENSYCGEPLAVCSVAKQRVAEKGWH